MSSSIAERPPLTLNTGRWICRPCQKRRVYIYSDTGLNACPSCGERHWWPEWDAEALAKAAQRSEGGGCS